MWCQRSDGLRVFNGCERGLKPSRTETCQPKCSVSHSFCNEQIVCACKNNFIPIFSSHGHLIHCLSNSNQFRNNSNDVSADTSSRGKKDPSCKYTSMIKQVYSNKQKNAFDGLFSNINCHLSIFSFVSNIE